MECRDLAEAPRKLIWVCGSAVGVPGSGEIVTAAADACAQRTRIAESETNGHPPGERAHGLALGHRPSWIGFGWSRGAVGCFARSRS